MRGLEKLLEVIADSDPLAGESLPDVVQVEDGARLRVADPEKVRDVRREFAEHLRGKMRRPGGPATLFSQPSCDEDLCAVVGPADLPAHTSKATATIADERLERSRRTGGGELAQLPSTCCRIVVVNQRDEQLAAERVAAPSQFALERGVGEYKSAVGVEDAKQVLRE